VNHTGAPVTCQPKPRTPGLLSAPLPHIIGPVAKKIQSFADPSGLRTIKLQSLAVELSEIGARAFRKKYPGPFLLVIYTPSTNPGLSEHTVWTRHGRSATTPPDAITKAIPLLEEKKTRKKVTVGRAEQNDIIIRGSGISKTHAAFLPGIGGDFRLVDMGSRNGTAVNGITLDENRPIKLNTGDKVSFWWYQFQFVELNAFIKSLQDLA